MADLRASGLGGVPKGATADRPSSPSIGDVFYNGTLGCLEIYTSQGWAASSAPPAIPESVVATNQGSGRAFNNGQASVAFSAGSNGGISSDYEVTPSPATSPSTFTGSSSPIIVTGLQSSTQYTYTVKSRNNFGTSVASSASSAVPSTTVSQAPSISAVGGNSLATITITPGSTGGSAITGYTIVSSPATTTQTTSSTTYTFTGLTNGTSYTFTATATNANGTSLASSASNSVTAVPPVLVDYLVVAGGGGGGLTNSGSNDKRGGGGGGGGLRSTVTSTGRGGSLENSLNLVVGNIYTITVGAGGPASTSNAQLASVGNGVASSISGNAISTVTSIGGGGGGNGAQNNNSYLAGAGGGCGGGGAGSEGITQTTSNAPGTTGQGYDGGTGQHAPGAWASGGGGGGAGSAGANAANGVGSNGGNGVAVSINGSSVTYAGGGAGGAHNGALGSAGSGTGSANTGGGGNYASAGHSGIVILRTLSTASSASVSPTTDGSYKVYTFNATGSITF